MNKQGEILGRKCERCGKGNGVTKFRVSRDKRVVMHPQCFRAWQIEVRVHVQKSALIER